MTPTTPRNIQLSPQTREESVREAARREENRSNRGDIVQAQAPTYLAIEEHNPRVEAIKALNAFKNAEKVKTEKAEESKLNREAAEALLARKQSTAEETVARKKRLGRLGGRKSKKVKEIRS